MGILIDVPAGIADFEVLGLTNVKLRRTCEVGWGVRITDFADGGFKELEPVCQEQVVDNDVIVYEATVEYHDNETRGPPLRELPRR